MIGTYKDYKHFIQCIDPYLDSLYEEFYKRPDPKFGDKFIYRIDPELNKPSFIDLTFIKVEFDSEFKNGVAFWYIFKNDNKEFRVWSINNVYDPTKLSVKERSAVYAFWKYCLPKNNE